MEEKKITFTEICHHGSTGERTRPVARIYGNLAGNPAIKTLQPERREKQYVQAI